MMDWLRIIAPYHDYGWFITLLAWAAVALFARRGLRAQPGWAWLPWAAWPGAASAVLEMGFYIWPLPAFQNFPNHLAEEIALSALTTVTVCGWIYVLPAKRSLRFLAIAGILAATGLRFLRADLGAFAVVGAGSLVAVALAALRSTPKPARIALLVTAALLWLSGTGPFASGVWQAARRIITLNEWNPVWSLAQMIAALTTLGCILASWLTAPERRREWRPFILGSACWLLLGLGLAAFTSANARQFYETHAIARVNMAAALMNKHALTELLTPDFKLTEKRLRQFSDGRPLWDARVPRLDTPAGAEVQRQLADIGYAGGTPGRFAILMVYREGWAVSIPPQGYSNNPLNRNKRSNRVGLFTPEETELVHAALRQSSLMPPIHKNLARTSSSIIVRAPILTENSKMAGWLMVELSRSDWLAAQLTSRFQAFAVVAFGFAIMALAGLQRERVRERETARAAAAASANADRLKTAFLAKVSHELRTPIQSVLGYGELLQHSVHDPLARRHLEALREHGELMRRLVNDLLDLSAIHAGAFRLLIRPAELKPLVQEIIESLRPRAQAKHLEFSLECAPDLPAWVELDRERVRQVLINLVGNALKFTDQGRVEVWLGARPEKQEILLTVRDTGPGISPADFARLFQPFERLDPTLDKEGTGLGLALTAGLCRSMGGDIAVESPSGGGALFRVWFRAPACPAPVSAAIADTSKHLLSGRRVLVADDNALVRELFTTSLENFGAKCTSAVDGEAALKAALSGQFDVMVLDLAMPKLDGVEVARRLRTSHNVLRIVGVSAHAGVVEREQAIAAGMDAFLAKPVNLAHLISTVAAQPVSVTASLSDNTRLAKLRKQFRGLARVEGAALATAITAADCKAAYARAHHLMNSAIAVEDDVLYQACVRVEHAAQARDLAALNLAWPSCEAALAPWLEAAGETIPAASFAQ